MDESKMKILDLIEEIKNKYPEIVINTDKDVYTFEVTNVKITIDNSDSNKPKYNVEGMKKPGRENILDLNSKENYSVLMLVIKLLNKGYSIDSIELEKSFQVGHHSGYLDLMITNLKNNEKYMFEVKSNKAINDYVLLKKPEDTKQALSYAFQDKGTQVVSYYTYNFARHEDDFYSIWLDDSMRNSNSVDDFYDVWNKIFDKNDYIQNNDVFQLNDNYIKYSDLKEIVNNDTKKIYAQFLNILRVFTVSDKPNAFIKFINLLLAKIRDEITEDKEFYVIDENKNQHMITGLYFQYISRIDTPESFIKRLNLSYKEGMKNYLNKDVIEYTDEDLKKLYKLGDEEEVLTIFNNVSLKKENPFAFIEIYDDETFYENFLIVKSMVEMIQNYKFKYGYKQQFLGDFFEELLNTSIKQEAGQFFTPLPIVDFMVDSLPYYEHMKKEILCKENIETAIPKVIDYACGAGHFLTSSMVKVQESINKLAKEKLKLTTSQNRDLISFSSKDRQYTWVNRENVVGIEKDYRLAKTTKITTYLNGDGRACIINGDGINKFKSKDYIETILYSDKTKGRTEPSISINKFDYVISNPPYSVLGYIKNLKKNGIELGGEDFSLFENDNEKDATIERLFVERTYQLLKGKGIAAIILPQSVLTSDKYYTMRKFIFTYFKIIGFALTADNTFAGTTTSPVIIFMQKKTEPKYEIDYKIVSIMSPKYKNPNLSKITNKEKIFLGYEFSQNRNKSGITLYKDSKLKSLSKYIKRMILGKSIDISEEDKEFVEIVNLKDKFVNDENKIYPKRKKVDGKPISYYCDINKWTTDDFEVLPEHYIEISNIQNGKIIHDFSKNKNTNHFCQKGDILVSSLNLSNTKIVIADDNYKVSSAIHILTCKEGFDPNEIIKKLKEKETIEQINSYMEGFKITYAKISDKNLSQNVYI